LISKGDDVNSLTQKILHEWNMADKVNYFDDATQVGKAKAYAEKAIEIKK
jgi:hypothetical protein